MDLFAFLNPSQGKLAPQPFWFGVLAVWVGGLAAQLLLSADIMARFGVWPFIAVQAALLWVWLVLHITRLRDAGQGPAAAYGVALIYVLSICLLLMLVAFFTNPNAVDMPRSGGNPAGDAAGSTLLVLFLLAIIITPDFGVFTTILKGLILITFLPAVISLLFSIRTGLRKRAP